MRDTGTARDLLANHEGERPALPVYNFPNHNYFKISGSIRMIHDILIAEERTQ
jgi:hypothetical protein